MGHTWMRTMNVLGGILLFLVLVPMSHAEQVGDQRTLEFKQLSVYGGTGNQRGNSVSFYNASDLYVAGVDEAALGGQALALHYTLAFDGGKPVLDWAIRWPTTANGSGNPNSEVFDGVVGTRAGVFCAGRSWSQTQDGVGDKEHKSVLVKFPLSGATGSGIGGAEWVAKPNFFTYRGNESFLSVAFGPDRIGAAHYLYAAGYGQTNGANNTAILSQYNPSDGTLRWSRVLGNTGWFMSSFGSSVTTLNGNVYVAGMTHYPYYLGTSSLRIVLWKYDDAGNLVWVRSQPGVLPGWRGAMAVIATHRYQSVAGDLYVVGGLKKSDGRMAVLLLKYDEAGNLLWSKTLGTDVSYEDIIAYGITANDHARTPPEGQRLYVTGRRIGTNPEQGADVFLLEVDPATGSFPMLHHFSGARGDDVAWGIQKVGSHVYVVGETKGSSANGNVSGQQTDVMVLDFLMKPVQTSLAVSIDIKPGSTENSINPKSQGKIPVAILSAGRFKAPEQVKQTSLRFGRLGTEQSLAFCKPEDIDGDGLLDLMCHFETEQTAFQTGDTLGNLKGQTTSGRLLTGKDLIRIVPSAR